VSKINEMGGGVKFKCADVKNIIEEDGQFWFYHKKTIFLDKIPVVCFLQIHILYKILMTL
jgi:hypothetical protein